MMMMTEETHHLAVSTEEQSLFDLPDKEAVAAISASLAFRRFDDLAKTSSGDDGSSSSQADPMDGSLRRLSSILSQSGSGSVGKVSLDALFNGGGGGGSHRGSWNGGHVEKMLPKLTPLEANTIAADISEQGDHADDVSLNSDDLQNDGDMDSMTVSLLEAKKLSSRYNHLEGTTSSNDDDTSCNSSCDDSIELEVEECSPKSTATAPTLGFTSSLQQLQPSRRSSSLLSSEASSKKKSWTQRSSSSKSKIGSLGLGRKKKKVSDDGISPKNHQNLDWKDSSLSHSECLKKSSKNEISSSQRQVGRRQRVSWQLDCDDGALNFALGNVATKENSRRLSINESLSEDAGSIDLETAVSSSLEADQELLASMIQIANMSITSLDNSGALGGHGSVSSLRGIDKKSHAVPATASTIAVEGMGLDVVSKDQNGATMERGAVSNSNVSTAAAVTRLAYQEVEDYRARLRKKRAAMDEIDNTNSDTHTDDGTSSQDGTQDLNNLLLENASNISNAPLLQRALFALRIHNSDRGNATINKTTATEPISSNFGPRSHSEHTGIDRMALNHLLGGLSSSGSTPKHPTPSTESNANWDTFTSESNNGGSNLLLSNSFSSFRPTRRRNTYREGGEARRTPAESEIGAHHSNEPAPSLVRRTFASGPNRREARAEARRNTLHALARERSLVPEEPNLNDTFNNSSISSDTDSSNDRTHSESLNCVNEQSTSADTASAAASSTAARSSLPTSSSISPNNGNGSGGIADVPNDMLLSCQASPSIRRQGFASSASPDSENALHQNIRHALRASVRLSRRESKLLQAILVSDEIIEADHIETFEKVSSHDAEMGLSLQMRLEMMEEVLEERDEEQAQLVQRFRRRERIWVTVMATSVIIIIALIIVIAAS